jgi:phosphotriesterase-related protein
MTKNEKKVLRAAAKAQQYTGAPLYIHPGRRSVTDSRGPLEIISELKLAGANINRTVMCHIERTISKLEECLMLGETGCYLEYDLFGWEGYHCNITVDLPNDHFRVNQVIKLINEGYLNQILISQDICWKHRLRKYGGHGYDHILRNTVPMMRVKGMTEEQIFALLVENPKHLLQFS